MPIFWFLFFIICITSQTFTQAPCLGYDPDSNTCQFCDIYSYLPENISAPFDPKLCQRKNNLTQKSKKVLILQNLSIFGSVFSIFDNFYWDLSECLQNESENLAQFFFSELTIYIAKGSYIFFSEKSDRSDYFRRSFVNITLLPLYCVFLNLSDFCVSQEPEKIKISLKSSFNLYISYRLYISGLQFEANSLFPSNRESKQSLITMETIYDLDDINKIAMPIVKIENSDFENIFFVDSLLQIENVGGVALKNLKFYNFGTSSGIFTEIEKKGGIFYRGTIGESNILNNNLHSVLQNSSFIILTEIEFYTQKEIVFLANRTKFEIFALKLWENSLIMKKITIQNFTNNLNGRNFIFFYFEKITVVEIENLMISNCKNIEVFNFYGGQVKISNSQISNISNFSSPLFNLNKSSITFKNFTFDLIFNDFAKDIFCFVESNVSMNQILFRNVYNLLVECFNGQIIVLNLICQNSSFIDFGFNFENLTLFIDSAEFDNIFANSTILTISNLNSTNITNSVFRNINSPNLMKCINLFSIFISNNFFLNLTVNSLISRNSIVSQIFFQENVFANSSITCYIFNVINLFSVSLTRNYFSNIFSDLDHSTFAFQLNQGFFSILNNTFENIVLSQKSYLFFDIEFCDFSLLFSNFHFSLNFGGVSVLLGFWMANNVFVDSCNFLMGTSGFFTGVFGISEIVISFILINSNLFSLEKPQNTYAMSIILSGTPIVYLENNTFTNFKCLVYNTETGQIIGSATLRGRTSNYEEIFLVKIFNNSFENCYCDSGGSIGIVDFDEILIQEVSSKNSQAFYGGTFFIQDCINVSFFSSNFTNSQALRGSMLFISYVEFVGFYDLLLVENYGIQTGGIESRIVDEFEMINCVFENSTAGKMGGVISIYSGNLIISNCFIKTSLTGLYGGSIYLSDFANMTIFSLFVENSWSLKSGGVVYVQNANLIKINSSSFINCVSEATGGVFQFNSMSKVYMNDITTVFCKAKKNGVIFFSSSQEDPVIFLFDITCFNNSAFYGSCVSFVIPSNLSIDLINCFENHGNLIVFELPLMAFVHMENGNFSNNVAWEHLFLFSNLCVFMANIEFYNNSIYFDMFYVENLHSLKIQKALFYRSLNLSIFGQMNQNSILVQIFNGLMTNATFIDVLIEEIALDFASTSIFLIFAAFKSSNLSFFESVIKNNSYSGVRLFFLGDNSTGFFESCYFADNYGPIMSSSDSNIVVKNSIFSQNFNFEMSSNDIFLERQHYSVGEETFYFKSLNTLFEISGGLSIHIYFIEKIYFLNNIFIGASFTSNALLFQNFHSSIILNTLFYYLSCYYQACLKFFTEKDSAIFVNSSNFISCKSNFESMISIEGAIENVLFSNNFFAKNSAKKNYRSISLKNLDVDVGVITFYSTNSQNSTVNAFQLLGNTFTENFGKIYPTVYSNIFISESSNIYQNNSANFNLINGRSYPPYSIIVLFLSDQNSIANQSIYNISSANEFSLIFSVVDALNQTLQYDEVSMASVTSQGNPQVKKISNNIAQSRKGVYSLEKIVVYVKPSTNFQLGIQVKLFDLFKTEFLITKNLSFQSRNCEVGEVLTLDYQCLRCPQYFYSIETQNYSFSSHEHCKKCPPNTFCPGGSILIPNSGFWRISPSSLLILPCMTTQYCLGIYQNISNDDIVQNLSKYQKDENLLKGICHQGHEGNLCEECVKNFGKYSANTFCLKCSENYIPIFLRLILCLFFISCYLFASTQAVFRVKQNSSLFSEVSKIYFNHMQKLSVLIFNDFGSVIQWMKDFWGFFQFGNLLNENVFSNECLISFLFNDRQEEFNFYIIKIFITMLMPIVFVVVCLIIYQIDMIFRRSANKNSVFLPQFILIFLISSFLLYALITKSSISLLNCIKLDESASYYLYSSPNLLCWSTKHYFYLYFFGVIGIFFFVIAYPGILFFMIKIHIKKHSKINQPGFGAKIEISAKRTSSLIKFANFSSKTDKIQEKTEKIYDKNLGLSMGTSKKKHAVNYLFFFYKDYRIEFYFWETIIFLQKFLLTLSQNLGRLISEELKNFFVFVILFIYLYNVVIFLPFKRKLINFLEINSIITTIFTKACLFLISSEKLNDEQKNILVILQIISNIFFLFYLILVLIRYSDWKKIINIIAKRFFRIKDVIEKIKPKKFQRKREKVNFSKKNLMWVAIFIK